jgi:hypothetical protein
MDGRLGRLNRWRAEGFFLASNKKEEFPGIMENMLPGNSFPQICVVSVNKSVGIAYIVQGYGRSVALSNRRFVLFSN